MDNQCCCVISAACGTISAACGMISEGCGTIFTTCGIISRSCGIISCTCGVNSECCGMSSEVCGKIYCLKKPPTFGDFGGCDLLLVDFFVVGSTAGETLSSGVLRTHFGKLGLWDSCFN